MGDGKQEDNLGAGRKPRGEEEGWAQSGSYVPPVQFSVLCFLITLAAVPIFIFLYLGLLSFLKKQ